MASMSEHASALDPMDNTVEYPAASKKKRNLPGTPDPHAEVIALSPRTLMATNRFVCEVCGKGFQRDQNLQLHRRGHNLPWKLKQRDDQEIKKRVYVCPEVSCVHHDPSRALGDLTGIKKHYFRKHGDKKWKCEKCSKRYAVQSDWKAHKKVCGTREYRCDCGTVFSRRDSFITHRAFCDALAEESAKLSACNPVETGRQFSDLDGNGADVRVSSLEASSSPFSQLASGGLDMEPSVREASRFITGLQEGDGDSIALNYGSEMSSHRPNKGPSLSLSFGTGPGPGPPGELQMMERLPHTDNILPMKKVGVFGEETTPWPGMFASMLDSPRSALETLKGYTSTNSDAETWCLHSIGEQDSKASVSMTGENSFRNSALSQFAPPSSSNISSFIENGFFPSRLSSCHQQHAGNGQLPATALLQKAAMMGATSGIPSLFHSFGGDPRYLAMNEGRQEPFFGVSSSFSSPYSSLLSNEKQSMGCSMNSSDRGHRTEGSLYPTSTGQGSVQELLNSLCSGGAAIFPSKPEDTPPAMCIASGPVQGTNGHHYMMGPSNIFLGGLKHQDSSTLAGLSAGDTYEGSRTTLDFLGVGRGETAGMTVNMAQTLSQREIASMTTSSAGIKREPVTPRKGTVPAWVEGGSSSWSHGS